MNARQTKKRLKNEIDRLRQEMSELYNAYNQPVNVTNTTMPIQEFKASMVLPAGAEAINENIEYVKMEISEKLFEGIKDCIIYDVDSDGGWLTQVTGSIFVGVKNKEYVWKVGRL